MKKFVLPLFFLGLGSFVMSGCGDKAQEKEEGEKPQSSQKQQDQEQKKLYTVSKLKQAGLDETPPVAHDTEDSTFPSRNIKEEKK